MRKECLPPDLSFRSFDLPDAAALRLRVPSCDVPPGGENVSKGPHCARKPGAASGELSQRTARTHDTGASPKSVIEDTKPAGEYGRGEQLAALLTRKTKQTRQQRMPGNRTRASRGRG
jgi:hypothetical protein